MGGSLVAQSSLDSRSASKWWACNDAYVTALPGYRPKLRAELERAIGENLSALRAEREALLSGAKAAPAS